MPLPRTLTALTAAPLLLVSATGCGLIPVQHSKELTVVMCAEESTEPVCVENGPATEEEREAVEELLDQTAEVVVYRFLTEGEVFDELTGQGSRPKTCGRATSRPGTSSSSRRASSERSSLRPSRSSAGSGRSSSRKTPPTPTLPSLARPRAADPQAAPAPRRRGSRKG